MIQVPRNLREASCNLDLTMRVAIEFFVVVIRAMALPSEHLAGRLRYAWAASGGNREHLLCWKNLKGRSEWGVLL
jgi:hypothetical protein